MNDIEILETGYTPLFNSIVEWAREQHAVRALFLSVSVAKGTADAFSDLDLVVVTDKWHRIDLIFGEGDSGILEQALLPVFDPDALFDGAPTENEPAPVDADRVIALSTEFLRVLGLSVVVRGRKDAHSAHDGSNLLRNTLIELFLMEPEPRVRSSAKKLLPLLTGEQQEILKSLPPMADDVDILGTFNATIAAVFLARARLLTESLGGAWPVAAEEATHAYLKGIETD